MYIYVKLHHFAVYLKHNIINQLQFFLIAAIGMVKKKKKKKKSLRASLVVQRLRLSACQPPAGHVSKPHTELDWAWGGILLG